MSVFTVADGLGRRPLAQAARAVRELEFMTDFPTISAAARAHLPDALAPLAAVGAEQRRLAKAKVVKEFAALATSASYRSANTGKP